MKTLLFFSIFLSFSCTREFNLYSMLTDEASGIKYIWKVDAAQVLLDLVDKEYRDTPIFQETLNEALRIQETTNKNLVSIFGQAYSKQSTTALATFFSSNENLNIEDNFSNKKVLDILQNEVDKLIEQHIIIVQNRVRILGYYITKIAPIKNTDQFAVDIQNAGDQTQEYLEIIGKLEFWELYQDINIFKSLIELNTTLKEEAIDNSTTLEAENNPLFDLLTLNIPQRSPFSATLGYAKPSDVEAIMDLLTGSIAKKIFRSQLDSIRFVWDANSFENNKGERFISLYALKTKGQETSPLNQKHITRSTVSPSSYGNYYYISLDMNEEGRLIWKEMTTDNVGKQIAITLDHKVYSAPIVNEPITNGHVSISGDFKTFETARDFSNLLSLKSILPSRLTLVKKEVYPNKN